MEAKIYPTLLSISVIAKNEEKNLPVLFQSLSPLREVLDVEIVVTDTGSTDKTVDVAQKNQSTVVYWKWNDNFSDARNFGLKNCRSPWIMWLDADDFLEEATIQWLIKNIHQLNSQKVYLFNIVSKFKNETTSSFLQTRLFPQGKNLSFQNPIHESLSKSVSEVGLSAVDTRMNILHRGYEDPEILKRKILRNKKILQKLYEEKNIPISLLFSLARTFQTEENYSEAEKLFREIIKNPDAQADQKDVYLASLIYCGQTLGFKGQLQDACTWFKKHLSLGRHHIQYLFEYGKILLALGHRSEANSIFKEAQTLTPPSWSIPTDWEAIQSGLKQLTTSENVEKDLNLSFGKIQKPFTLPYPTNTLSVVMIVKNEKDNIRAAIDSIRPIADEIIINDTGSTDGTQEILEELNVTWFQSEWKDDFSLARNQSLQKATSAWVLWLDADDRIPPEQVENFLKLKTAPLDRIFGFQVINTHAGQPLGARFMQIRMFPNHPDIHFERKIHEQMIFSAAKLGVYCIYTETTIHHTGYESEDLKKEKARRNLLLAEKEKALIGVDPTLTMSCGDSYFILEEWEKGIEMYKGALAIPNIQSVNKDVYRIIPTYIGLGYQRLQNHNSSIEWLDKGLALSPDLLEPRYYKAISLRALGRKTEAKEVLSTLLELPLVHSSVANQYDGVRIYSFHTLAELLIEEKKFSDAIEVLEKMHQSYTQVVESWSSLGLCYFNTNQPNKAIAAWEKAIALNPARTHTLQEKLKEIKKEQKESFPEIKGEEGSPLNASLCMIVKNEAENIGTCLESVKGLFRETVIVDTGSTDGTQNILQSFGAKVIQTQWENDFSKARNLGIECATAKWIFWLDADDIVLKLDRERIVQLLSNTPLTNKAYGFLVQNSADKGRTGTVFNQIRLFPNHPKLRFSAPVHEQILPALEKESIPVEYTSIKIIHTGYSNDNTARKKQLRNRDILEKQIQSNNNVTPVTLYTLAHAYLDLGENEKAAEGFINAAELAEKNQNNPHILQISPAKTAAALANMGKYQQALNVLEIGLKQMEPHPETILLKAQVEEKLENLEEAYNWYTRLLELEEEPTFIPVDYNLLKIKALEFLGRFWMQRGQRDLAVELLKSGIRIKSGNPYNKILLQQAYQKFGVEHSF